MILKLGFDIVMYCRKMLDFKNSKKKALHLSNSKLKRKLLKTVCLVVQ